MGENQEKDQNGVKLLEHPEKIENDQIENTENLQEENKEKEIEKDITEEKEETKPNEEKAVQELEQEPTKEEASERKKKDIIGIVLLIIGLIVILAAIFSTIFAVINLGSVKMMKGITIGQLDVSGMTKEEVAQKLNDIYSTKLSNQLILKHGEYESEVTYESLEVNYDINGAIEKAYQIGRGANVFQDNIDIIKTWLNGQKINIEKSIDEETANEISQNINNNIKDAVSQSSYYIEDEKLIITSGKKGAKVNSQKLVEKIYEAIENEKLDKQEIEIPVITAEPEKIDIDKIHQEIYKEVKDAYYTKDPFTIHPEENGIDFDVESAKQIISEAKESYEISLIITKPSKTVKDIGTEAFPDRLATFSTKYSASNKNRTTNLQLAAKKINGTVLLSGEEFSYNKTLGERTIAAGYKEAAVYSNGEVVDGIGGGICQISTTLYDAIVMANLKVTVRRNHQFVTSYVPGGKDATVVYGSQDFKFVNTRKYPVRIEATVSGGIATVSIWGVKEDVEYDITIETKKVATIAYTTQYIQDPSLPSGQQVVKQAGKNGSKYEAYKVMKLNGQVVSTTLLSKDTYNAMKRIVRVGTGG